ncbi:MAG: hypothetical protein ACR2MT_14820 [Aurantibacter sp.]
MKKLFFLLLGVIVVLGSCNDRDDNVNAVNIRVKNVANFNFNKVVVGEEDKIHENVAPGKYSDYLEYETAYHYAYIKIENDSTSYVLQPIDFVGETPLNIGFYTYELSVSEQGDVSLEFKVD